MGECEKVEIYENFLIISELLMFLICECLEVHGLLYSRSSIGC